MTHFVCLFNCVILFTAIFFLEPVRWKNKCSALSVLVSLLFYFLVSAGVCGGWCCQHEEGQVQVQLISMQVMTAFIWTICAFLSGKFSLGWMDCPGGDKKVGVNSDLSDALQCCLGLKIIRFLSDTCAFLTLKHFNEGGGFVRRGWGAMSEVSVARGC